MIPEFIGRLPVLCPLRPLAEEELVKLLLEPRNAILRQYQALFAMEGATLEFTPEALREVAREALKKDTGARAVRSILEAFMLEHLYDLPGKARGNRFLVTPEVVRREAAPKVEPLPRDDRTRPAAPLPGVDDRRESA